MIVFPLFRYSVTLYCMAESIQRQENMRDTSTPKYHSKQGSNIGKEKPVAVLINIASNSRERSWAGPQTLKNQLRILSKSQQLKTKVAG